MGPEPSIVQGIQGNVFNFYLKYFPSQIQDKRCTVERPLLPYDFGEKGIFVLTS
jgi:hypothetical protein